MFWNNFIITTVIHTDPDRSHIASVPITVRLCNAHAHTCTPARSPHAAATRRPALSPRPRPGPGSAAVRLGALWRSLCRPAATARNLHGLLSNLRVYSGKKRPLTADHWRCTPNFGLLCSPRSVRPRSPDMAWSHSTSAAARFSSRAQTALGRSHLLNAFNTNSFRMVLLLASPSFTAPKPSHPIVKKWSLLGKNKSQKQSDWEPACSDSTAHSLQLDACHPESCTAGVCSLKYSVHKQAISIPLLLAPINSTCFYYNKSVTARQLS